MSEPGCPQGTSVPRSPPQPPHLGQRLRRFLLENPVGVKKLPLGQRGRVEGQHLLHLRLQPAAHLGQPQDALCLRGGRRKRGRERGRWHPRPHEGWSRPHLLHNLCQRLQGGVALRREPGQVVVGLSPGLVHFVLELLELPEHGFLLLPRAPVPLLVVPELSREPSLGGRHQILEAEEP